MEYPNRAENQMTTFLATLGSGPLGIFPADKQGQERMEVAGIKHGRTAMIGVVDYVVEEYVTKMAVVDDTPVLLQPITEMAEEAASTTVVIRDETTKTQMHDPTQCVSMIDSRR